MLMILPQGAFGGQCAKQANAACGATFSSSLMSAACWFLAVTRPFRVDSWTSKVARASDAAGSRGRRRPKRTYLRAASSCRCWQSISARRCSAWAGGTSDRQQQPPLGHLDGGGNLSLFHQLPGRCNELTGGYPELIHIRAVVELQGVVLTVLLQLPVQRLAFGQVQSPVQC